MAVKKIGVGLIVIGTLGIALSVLIAFLFRAQADIQSIQILCIEISVITILIGLWLTLAKITEDIQLRKQIGNLVDQILNFPTITWVLMGFLLVYILLFIAPIFL